MVGHGRQVVDAREHRVRHVYPDPNGAVTVLGRRFGFRNLPPEWIEGSFTRREGDAGEWSITFPNVAAGDGIPYATRFDPDRHLEWVEIYDGTPEVAFVGRIERVRVTVDTVTISGSDAWAELRHAVELDRTLVAAPRDVIEAHTQVWVPVLADDFTGSALDTVTWPTVSGGDAAVVGGSFLALSDLTGDGAELTSRTFAVSDDRWSFSVHMARIAALSVAISFQSAAGTIAYQVALALSGEVGIASIGGGIAVLQQPGVLADVPMTVTVERKGRWVAGYLNGRLIGVVGAAPVPVERVKLTVAGAGAGVIIDQVAMRSHQPLLMRGTDKGDYVLPPAAYPTSGLRGRYYSDTDLQGVSAAERAVRILGPHREASAERVEAVTAAAGLTTPDNIPSDYFSVRWHGAVYLRLSLGDYGVRLTSLVGGARLWVGKTLRLADAVIDDWAVAGARTTTGTIDASDLGGEDGWYPIVLEYHDDAGAAALALQFSPPGAGTYTDPGGGTITRGSYQDIPATSLTPLGCVDQRIQGATHFDIVQQVARDFGYQLTVEPQSLESGEWPGRLVPRIRVGRDTAIRLTGESFLGLPGAGEHLAGATAETDTADQATTVLGRGAGIPDGAGGQVTAQVSDINAMTGSLFDLQAQVDAGDIGFQDLLAARLNAELALRSSPWVDVSGDARGVDQMADTWPLSGALSAMRWRVGDGVRLDLPELGVRDQTPRQIIQVTRTFVPEGRTGTSIAFRQRPKGLGRGLRRSLRSALAPARTYQRQYVTITGPFTLDNAVAAGGVGGFQVIALMPGDRIVRAVWRIAINSTPVAAGIEINLVDRTTALGGPWGYVPTEVDITPYAAPASGTDSRLLIRAINKGGVTSGLLQSQVIVTVLR